MRKDLGTVIGVLTLALWLAAGEAQAQQMTVQPAQGQSAAQMQTDIAGCQAAATQATGYNPAQPPPAPAQASPQAGGRARGAAAGAAAGAVGAEARGRQHQGYDKLPDEAKQQYRQNEARDAAAAGAAVGASRQRQERRQGRRETAQTQQQQANAANAWNQSHRACLQQRGYAVTP